MRYVLGLNYSKINSSYQMCQDTVQYCPSANLLRFEPDPVEAFNKKILHCLVLGSFSEFFLGVKFGI